ncbi:MAG: NUDIX hydrolase [Dehalococcoidia bacterium]|nr:NUDIX hydrolase [Dehalococcoidia bacterium]
MIRSERTERLARTNKPRAAKSSPVKLIRSKRIHEGRIIQLRVDLLEVIDSGVRIERDVIEHPGAVVLIPIDSKGRLLLVEQYRHSVGETLMELPAGTLEPGEEPKLCANRELQEEVGYKAKTLKAVGGYYVAPGYTSEYLHLFLATGLTPSRLNGDEEEGISAKAVSVASALRMIKNGQIRDAKSVAGILKYVTFLKKA